MVSFLSAHDSTISLANTATQQSLDLDPSVSLSIPIMRGRLSRVASLTTVSYPAMILFQI